MSEGAVELVRDKRWRVTDRIRHRRTSGDSQFARIACGEHGEGILFPFDGEGDPCVECWGR